jgi:hypothetical protein
VSEDSAVHLAGRYVLAAEILGRATGQHPHRARHADVLPPADPGAAAHPARPNPRTLDQARRLRGARPAGAPPRPSAEPVTVQQVASNTGVIVVTGQKIALGRIHARQIVTIHVVADTMTIDLGEDTRTVRRTTTQPVRGIKAQQHRKGAHVPRQSVKHVLGLIRQGSGGTRQLDGGSGTADRGSLRQPR